MNEDDTRLVATDLAFRKDSATAIALSVRCRHIYILDVAEWQPKPKKPLIPSEVMASVIGMARAHNVESIAGDIYYIDTALEHTRAAGLAWHTIDNSKKEEAYTNFRILLRERRVHGLSIDTEAGAELVRQLRETRAVFTKGGRLQIVHARGGGHGDLVSALVGGAHVLWPYLLSEPSTALGDAYAVDGGHVAEDDEPDPANPLESRWVSLRP